MEKRLRSSLQSSSEAFLSLAVESNLGSSKSTLKKLVHGVKPSSDPSSSLPLALANSISRAVASFQKLPQDPPSPSASPPSKRPRRSQRKTRRAEESEPCEGRSDSHQRKRRILDDLKILSHILSLCVSHPGKTFSPSDLLPAMTTLHDSLVLFESDTGLSNDIAGLCEGWWKEGLVGRANLISQSLPFLVARSLTLRKKVDVRRVYSMRDAFALFDFEDESTEDLKMLLIRCVITPLYSKIEEGRKFVASVFGLSRQILKEALAVVRAQIPFGRRSALEGYGEIVLRAWKALDGELKVEIEDGFLLGLIEGAIHASSSTLAASTRRFLGRFINQRTIDGVDKVLFRLAEPIIFRSLQVTNSNVRLNALHLLLDLFPLEDPDATKEAKDTLLDKQFLLLERLLMDDCLDIRVVAVEGCCRILRLFWEVIPSSTITKIITKILDDMSHDSCCEVRLSTVNGIVYLLSNPQPHEILKVLLPRLGHLMLDNVTSVKTAMLDILLYIRNIRTFQFNKVVSLDVLLSTLANDQSQVAKRITQLLMPSYFPSRLTVKEVCERFIALLKRNPMAGTRFCEFVVSLGSSLDSVMQLVKEFVKLVFSHDKLDAARIEGLFLSVAYLCKDLASDPTFQGRLNELFAGKMFKQLLTAAPTAKARSAVFDIASMICPDNMKELLGVGMRMVVDCGGLPGDACRQVELKSVHKFLLSCNAYDNMLEAFTSFLQKTAYRCHIKFGYEIKGQSISSKKRKTSRSSKKIATKWKHVSGKNASRFEDDYAIAGGIAWQIEHLLTSEDARKAIFGPQIMELFHALEAIAEASIVECSRYEYIDVHVISAYSTLALHMALEAGNCTDDPSASHGAAPSRTSQTVVVQAMDHMLSCTDRMLQAVDSASSNLCSESKHHQKETTAPRNERHRETRQSRLNSEEGATCTKQGRVSNRVKILTAVLKFIIDSTELGFVSHLAGRCLKFACAYIQHVISILDPQSKSNSWFEEEERDVILCVKSSLSYASKFLSLTLRNANEASAPPYEAFILANSLLELIASVELSLGPAYATRLVAAASPWLPDLVIVLASCSIRRCSESESPYLTVLADIKLRFPSWLVSLSEAELHEMGEAHPQSLEDEDRAANSTKLHVFRKLMGSIISLLKRNPTITDAVGLLFLLGSAVCLERKEYGVALGLLHFLRVKLIGQQDNTWDGLDRMLESLPAIYPQLERDIDVQDAEDDRKRLMAARELLEPIWLYHVYETQRFTVAEEEEEE